MQQFIIRQFSTNPPLELELIDDGRYDFQKSLINEALQDSVVTFSMIDEETGLLKVAKAPCNIVLENDESCEERYILQYKWNKRDVSKEGVFKGWFQITFNGNITSDGCEFPDGDLIVPVEEDLRIIVKR